MALIEIKKDPSRKDLTWFGLMMGAFLGVVGCMARWRFDAPQAANGLWIAAALSTAVYYAIPAVRRPVFLGWIYATYPIGFVVGHVALGSIYYLVLTPVGLLLRLFGRDPMERKLERAAGSYWVEHRPCDSPPSRYFRQY